MTASTCGRSGPSRSSGHDAPAVRLFLDRARAADPAAARQDPDIAAVAGLCASLDGLPLAIELAAARLPGTTVSELAGNLRDRFGLLTVGRRAGGRHRSLRAVVDWSYEQLTPGQQDLFGQLAVFHGSFDAAAASAVADGPGDPAAVTRLLLHLADRSLVTAELDGDTTRYRLLETLRGYGLERLTERGQLDEARARHARWAADLVAQAERGLRGAAEASWAGTLERYFGDLRAAHAWMCGQDPELGLRMSAQLHWYALWRCHSEIYRWADASTAAARRITLAVLRRGARLRLVRRRVPGRSGRGRVRRPRRPGRRAGTGSGRCPAAAGGPRRGGHLPR